MATSTRDLARVGLRRGADPATGLPHGIRRAYGVLASSVLGMLLLAVLGASLGPRWDPQPLTDPIEVTSPSTAVAGAPQLHHYRTVSTVLTIHLAPDVDVQARLIEPLDAPGRVPGVVFVHGAGTGKFVDAFVVQAQRLAEAGIATLVPDKRLDTYSMQHRDYVAMAQDYARSVAVLRDRPRVDPDHVGVYAESEGGWIAPVMAAADPSLAFLALISDPVVPPRQQAAFAMDNYLRNTGVPGGVFRAIPRAAGMSPSEGFEYVDFDVRPFLAQVHQPIFVAYGTADASMPVDQGAQLVLRTTPSRGITVRYYADADHGLKVDKAVSPRFVDDLAGWVLGLPKTAGAGPQVAGAEPSQLFLAAPVPQPRWLASGRLMLTIVVTGAALVLVPGVLASADRAWRAARVRRRGQRHPDLPVVRGPRWAPGIAWRLAGVGLGALATSGALVWYLLAIARIAMDYQHNALIVQGGWLVVRVLGLWVVVAGALLGRRMLDVRASGRRVAPGAARLVGTWASALGTVTLLVVLAYWGVFQLGI